MEIDYEVIERAKADCDYLYPLAAESESTYRALVEEKVVIFSRCYLEAEKEGIKGRAVETLKALARTNTIYTQHLQRIAEAHHLYLRHAKAFDGLIQWIKLATGFFYKEGQRIKAGI